MRKIVLLAAAVLVISGATWFLLSSDDRGRKNPFMVAVLQYTSNNLTTLEGFKAGMENFGYKEGETIRYIFNGPVNQKALLTDEMEALLKQDPDLVFVSPTPAAVAARQATRYSGIPVVFAPVNDPISAGLVTNSRHPGANITGVRLGSSDGRRLQLLADLSPGMSHILVPFSANDKSAVTSMENARDAAEKIGIQLITFPIKDHGDIQTLLENLPDEADGIFLPRDGMVMSRIEDFIAVSLQKKLLLSTPRLKQVEMGALSGYGFIGFNIGEQAARLAHQILQGADPGTLPVETAEDYFFINLKTAKTIGLSIDEHLLRQAHFVISDE